MKYMPLRNFDIVDAALNFENDGVIMEGGCDLFTCKPTKDDKKLELKLENELDEEYQRSLRLAVAFAQSESVRKSSRNSRHSHPIPPNLARASPFGPLSVRANRRKFGYMLSTLNACHPDHDFFKAPKPYEFFKERTLDDVVNAFDDKILGAHGMQFQSGIQTPGGSFLWGIKMWRIIDSEMDIENCDIYSWNPKENPLDDFEPSFWSLHYFFHNKNKKRVTYLHARALKTRYDWGSDVYNTSSGCFADRDSTDNDSGEASPIRIQEEDIEETFVDVELLEDIIKRSRSIPSLAVDHSDSHSDVDSH
ncbi:mitogen-activated protein kinase MAF1 [Venturia nashicola]|nr:mitogen-activated protein kinase MAF1 [Venturia nashicola]